MARAVSQETFDGVVRENVEDLDMTVEEAAQDAIQQFKAQGVDLGNIITDPNMSKEAEKELSECLSRLSSYKHSDMDHIGKVNHDLKIISKWCDKGIPFRLLAGSLGAYNTLIKVVNEFRDEREIVAPALRTLTSLMTGYPDLLDYCGITLLSSVLSVPSDDTDTQVAALRWAQTCCLKHEKNRQNMVREDIHDILTALLQKSSNSPSILVEVCELMKVLTLDDDIREVISKAHEHARLLAVNNLCTLCELLGRYKSDVNTIPHILGALSAIVVRNEFCEKVDEARGILHIFDILTAHPDVEKVNVQCLKLIKVLAGNDDVKMHLMQAGVSPLLLAAMSHHKTSAAISSAGCGGIAALALRSPENAQTLVDNGAADALVDALKFHNNNIKVQKVTCLAIRNLVSRNKILCHSFLSLGAEELLNSVDEAAKDEAKAALRDLGCNVKLEEPFKGKGVKLSY